jgi:hypothetical protein
MLVGIMVNVLLGQAKVHNENGLVFLHARPGAEVIKHFNSTVSGDSKYYEEENKT